MEETTLLSSSTPYYPPNYHCITFVPNSCTLQHTQATPHGLPPLYLQNEIQSTPDYFATDYLLCKLSEALYIFHLFYINTYFYKFGHCELGFHSFLNSISAEVEESSLIMELGEEYAADRSVSKCLRSNMCYQPRVKGTGGLYSPDIYNKGI
jgi:hypothetical protein